MKHVTFADKSLLMGDDAADVLLEYARIIADSGRADRVTLRAIAGDGNEVDVDMLLDSGTIIAAESTNTSVNAPDNREHIAEIRKRLEQATAPVSPSPETSTGDYHWVDEF